MNVSEPGIVTIQLNGPNPLFVKRARRLGFIATFLSFLFTITIPLSWVVRYPILRASIPKLTPAHLLGVSFALILQLSVLALYKNAYRSLSKVLWGVIILCSAIVVLEYLTPEELPFADLIRVLDPVENIDKISPNSALCLFFSSVAALLISLRVPSSIRWGHALALLSSIVAGLALIGHAYTIQSLYAISDYSQMSVSGALGYILLTVSLLCVVPTEGLMRILVTESPAGVISRRLYATAITLPPILGFLALVSSGIWKWYDITYAIVLFVMASILVFTAMVAITSRRLERADLFRLQAEADLRASRERLRELSAHIQVMQEEERVKIAREVHDELGQSLTALKMDVSMLKKQLPTDEGINRRMNSMLGLVNGTIRSVQRISSELRPSVLDDLGLAAAIEWQTKEFEERSGIRFTLKLPIKELGVNSAQATSLFRIYQETLTNIARHSMARHVDVELTESATGLRLIVSDDGIGIDESSLTNGQSLGIMGMRERAALAGGTLEILSEQSQGTTIVVTMPRTLMVSTESFA